MEVELREHAGINRATGKPHTLPQWRVFVDGRAVGYIGWNPDSKLCIVAPVDDDDREELDAKVGELCKRTVTSVTLPPIPEPTETTQTDTATYDDFHDG